MDKATFFQNLQQKKKITLSLSKIHTHAKRDKNIQGGY